ncbi:uncharacterized protein PITG_17433 [Phytophthora infestans T30-4]|uniref:Uncharacterized protein n=1 Tax=Phytophthora infestans (strain T30-4) TaxID=403677 RepID=D0NW20_PHYIT|nr:uncharacterized protein PITG_17433 [Phytophthora infestans T30-4]EEY66856.1 hypothetical protein PITG_17433 [Phytophthora infestans T30-4]|eukprot:XP_002896743.1 hypothetical protein PITG_17433 [Phytophthora infestans T30-4]
MATALSATAASVDHPQAEIVPMAVLDAPSIHGPSLDFRPRSSRDWGLFG